MPSSYTQDQRTAELTTPLGKDKLLLNAFTATEGVSELFEFKIQASSDKPGLNFDDVIGKNCTLMYGDIDPNKTRRYFVGTLAEAHAMTEGPRASATTFGYSLTLRPWLWLLSKRSNSRVFNKLTAPDIIKKVFGDYGGVAVYLTRLEHTYPQLEYTVQHRETDLDFVSRLMEENGIAYYYKFSDGEQKLILADATSSYDDVPGSTRPYIPGSDAFGVGEEHLNVWTPERRFTTGKVKFNDYDFKKPSANLVAEKQGDAKYENPQLEYFEHPGKYEAQGDGVNLATVALNRRRAEDNHYHAAGDAVSLTPGQLMTLNRHDDSAQNQQYIVLRCSHQFSGQNYRSGGGEQPPYEGSYEFVRSNLPFAPPVVTPRPIIAGPQTAKVVGDGEIDVDEHGRILVHFHWGTKGEGDEESKSMRCRVAQVWAGAGWGSAFWPRVGMEVLVQFLDGDPDRPMVIGCVYNGDNKPPYPLGGKKNITGWKSNSTEGGGGFNEYVFDDTKGNELIRMHAQYNVEEKIENDRTTKILHNETMNVTNEIMITADVKLTLKVGASTIVMDPTSITLTSPTVSIQATAEFKSDAGMTSSHTAGAPYSITAPMVKIN